jgi:hypothetical protein
MLQRDEKRGNASTENLRDVSQKQLSARTVQLFALTIDDRWQ